MREKARATWEPAQQAALVTEAAGVLVGRGHTQTRPGGDGPAQPLALQRPQRLQKSSDRARAVLQVSTSLPNRLRGSFQVTHPIIRCKVLMKYTL